MICLITGATAGIGEATAELFAQEGHRVIITGRRASRLQKLSAKLEEAYGADVYSLAFDVRNQQEVEKAILSLPEDWRSVDLLVNNAGLARGVSNIDEGQLSDWEEMIDTNIKGLLYVSKAVIPSMKKKRSGHIINIGSIAGKETYPKGNVYCATKHAVDSLTKAMRIDLLPYGIKATSVCPGAVETEFSIVRFHGDKSKADKVYDGFQPLTALDVAEVILFAATRPRHVTINDVLVMPTAQANSGNLIRKKTL